MSEHTHGVTLPPGQTGSTFLHGVLRAAVDRHPDVLKAAELPDDPRVFRTQYARALLRFEATRVVSERRTEVARTLVTRTQAALLYDDDQRARPLLEALHERVPAPQLQEHRFEGTPGAPVEVPFEGRTYRGRQVTELAERLVARHHMTEAAADGLRWVVEHVESRGGRLDLRGERFALLGAGAELAPSRLLQRAGARVLWIDLVEPEHALEGEQDLAGTLVTAPTATDLLRRPREVAAAIERFAADGPVHLGLFAYAAGASREWRLCAAMNAIARAVSSRLPARSVRSLSLLVSPTTVGQVSPEDLRGAAKRRANRPSWQAALERVGLLSGPGQWAAGEGAIARATVSIQGASYQAAQYISKLAAAEVTALHGLDPDGPPAPLTVSPNMAGITRTRSLSHPVFQAAFLGAPAFGVQIFDPPTTRALNGWLMLSDLLRATQPYDPAQTDTASPPPGMPPTPRDRARRLFAQQIHGGIYSLPYVLEPTIRAAALLGIVRHPSVLFRRTGHPRHR